MALGIYKLVRNDKSKEWDVADAFIVAAESCDDARSLVHDAVRSEAVGADDVLHLDRGCGTECRADDASLCFWRTYRAGCEQLGVAQEYVRRGILIRSFHAG